MTHQSQIVCKRDAVQRYQSFAFVEKGFRFILGTVEGTEGPSKSQRGKIQYRSKPCLLSHKEIEIALRQER